MVSADYREALAALIQAAGGDPGVRLSRVQHQAVRSRVRDFLRDKVSASDVDDVADEAVSRFLVALMNGQVNLKRNPDAYLLRTAERIGIDILRRRREDPVEVADFSDRRLLDGFVAVDDTDLINWMFSKLRAARDVEARKVLAAARDLADLGERATVRSVSERTGTPPSTVYRAVLRLRALLTSAQVEHEGRQRRSKG